MRCVLELFCGSKTGSNSNFASDADIYNMYRYEQDLCFIIIYQKVYINVLLSLINTSLVSNLKNV